MIVKNHGNGISETDDVKAGCVSLRFLHPKKNLTFLSALLELPCHRTWKAGAPRQTPKGTPLPGVYDQSYWMSRFEFTLKQGFQGQFMNAVDHLMKAEQKISGFIDSGGEIELYLQLDGDINHGGIINNDTIVILGRLGIKLLIEVFP